MVKFIGPYVTAQEVPNEISLVFAITNCPNHCEGCHSPHLRADIGEELTPWTMHQAIKKYQDGITCVCFMGTGNDPLRIGMLNHDVHLYHPELKTCIYTGDDNADLIISYLEKGFHLPDYFKWGSYQAERGPLNSPTTNQHMWRKIPGETPEYEDITSWFWRKKE